MQVFRMIPNSKINFCYYYQTIITNDLPSFSADVNGASVISSILRIKIPFPTIKPNFYESALLCTLLTKVCVSDWGSVD